MIYFIINTFLLLNMEDEYDEYNVSEINSWYFEIAYELIKRFFFVSVEKMWNR